MIEARLELDMIDGAALAELFGEKPVVGSECRNAELATNLVLRSVPRKGFGFGETVEVVLLWSGGAVSGVALNLLSSWLYDRFKGRVRVLRHGAKPVRPRREELLLLLEQIYMPEEVKRRERSAPPAWLKRDDETDLPDPPTS